MAAKSNSERMGSESILPLLFKLAIPAMIGMASQAIYNVVDSIFVGHISKDALSAVTLAFPIQMILIAIAIGTGVGVTSLISRSLGRADRKKAGLAAEHAILAGVALSAVFAVLGIFFAEAITRIFTNDPVMIDMTSRYVRIILMGSAALFIPQILQGILRGEGNAFIPMLVMIVSAALNIGLDPLFIYGIGFFPELGLEGAAYATVLARIIGGIVLVCFMVRSKKDVEMNLKAFKFQPSILAEIYKIGFPAMAMQLLGSFTLVGVNLILGSLSTTAIAAYGIYYRLQSFVFMPVFGLGQGVLPITGYNYGKGNLERVKRTVVYGMLFSTVFTLIGLGLFQIFPHSLIAMFNDNEELIRVGVTAMKSISLGIICVGPTMISANVFQALGRGTPSLVISILRNLGILLPMMYFLGQAAGIDAVWYAFPITEMITCAMSIAWLARISKAVVSEADQLGTARTA
jgi:putative MATE family efflux protein